MCLDMIQIGWRAILSQLFEEGNDSVDVGDPGYHVELVFSSKLFVFARDSSKGLERRNQAVMGQR